MARDWFDDDRAILLYDKAQSVPGVYTELLADFLWNRDLPFRGQRRCRHFVALLKSHILP